MAGFDLQRGVAREASDLRKEKTLIARELNDAGTGSEACRTALRKAVLDWLDDSQESAVEVINALADTMYDISAIYFGPPVAGKIFESFAGVARQRANLNVSPAQKD